MAAMLGVSTVLKGTQCHELFFIQSLNDMEKKTFHFFPVNVLLIIFIEIFNEIVESLVCIQVFKGEIN